MMPRLRTFTLWTGTTLSVLIAVAFVVSGWWWVVIQVTAHRGPAIYVVAGSFAHVADSMQSVTLLVVPSRLGLSRWNDWSGESGVYVQVPLYAVFAAAAIPTLLVWRFWPKPPKPGHCRCGYDLTGNTSGVCPECGVEVQA